MKARICHISGQRPGSPRYDDSMSDKDRHGFENLILLCPTHHVLIDDLEPQRFSVETLREMKDRASEHGGNVGRWADEAALDKFSRMLVLVMAREWALPPVAVETMATPQSATVDVSSHDSAVADDSPDALVVGGQLDANHQVPAGSHGTCNRCGFLLGARTDRGETHHPGSPDETRRALVWLMENPKQ